MNEGYKDGEGRGGRLRLLAGIFSILQVRPLCRQQQLPRRASSLIPRRKQLKQVGAPHNGGSFWVFCACCRMKKLLVGSKAPNMAIGGVFHLSRIGV